MGDMLIKLNYNIELLFTVSLSCIEQVQFRSTIDFQSVFLNNSRNVNVFSSTHMLL